MIFKNKFRILSVEGGKLGIGGIVRRSKKYEGFLVEGLFQE